MGRETFGEVRDGSGDATGGPEWVVRYSGRYRTGRGTPGRSGTLWQTLPKVRDRSGDLRGGLGRVGGRSLRS